MKSPQLVTHGDVHGPNPVSSVILPPTSTPTATPTSPHMPVSTPYMVPQPHTLHLHVATAPHTYILPQSPRFP
jgi:hypothetical protein